MNSERPQQAAFASMFRFVCLLCLVVPLMLSSCGKKIVRGGGGEPAVKQDTPPPDDYRPVYVKQVKPVLRDFTPGEDHFISATRIECSNPHKVQVYIHLLDSGGTYWSGAASGDNKRWWCEIVEEYDGTRRKIDQYWISESSRHAEQLALALVMDHSGSMGRERALAVQEAAGQLVQRKKSGDAVALLKYDDSIAVETAPETDTRALMAKLPKVGLDGFGGLTAINNGIAAGIRSMRHMRDDYRKAVLVFTDGEDNSSTIEIDSVVTLARQTATVVCAVDFGYNVSNEHLREIARQTGGSYHRMYRTGEFDDVFEDVYKRLTNYYVFEYSPDTYGVHRLYFKLCFGKDTLRFDTEFDNTPRIGDIALVNVLFDVNKASITSNSIPAVEKILALLRAYPNMRIELRGHTDSTNGTNDPLYNVKLSQKRADAVREKLIVEGIDAQRIATKGFGESRPVADNSTPEGRARNRRTEFIILSR